MLTFSNATHRDLLDVQDRLRPQLRSATTLESAARGAIQIICTEFSSSVVLARMFITLPFGKLPEDLRRAAWEVVEAQGLHASVRDQTPVLTLLSACGKNAEWCDRRRSRGHAAIPLCTASFLDSIPMIARMMQEMGVDLGLRSESGPYAQKVLNAGWVGLFYVEDARSARDERGRRIIPASDFVDTHSVRTVFGLGKAYGNGSIASFVVFSNAIVSRDRVEALAPLVNGFKAATLDLVSTGAIFDDAATAGTAPGTDPA